MHVHSAFLLASTLAFSAPAPQEPEIARYDVLVEPDFDAGRLRVESTITLTAAARDSIYFTLNSRFDSVRVHRDSRPAEFRRVGKRLTVVLGETRGGVIAIRASGILGRSDDEERSIIGRDDLFLLWSDGWYPARFDTWAEMRVTVLLPDGFLVIAPGEHTQRRYGDGITAHAFESRVPVAALSVFADRRWIRSDSVVAGVPVTLLLHPQSAPYRDTLFRSAADVVTFFADLHGVSPGSRFAFITQDSMFARRAYSGFIGYEPKWLEAEMKRTGYDAHETSLLWWGGVNRGSGPGAFQWTEGLGDYVEVLYSEARRLPLPANFARFRDQYLRMDFAQEPHITELRGNAPQMIVHGKYPWLLHVLRYRIGDRALRDGIRLLFSRYRYRTYTLDNLVQAFADASGQPLRWWREEWLERPGVPDLVLAYGLRRERGGVSVNGTITQRGSIYHIPVEIGVYSGSRRSVHRVELSGAATPVAILLEAEPDSIRLDPDRWLLARLRTTRADPARSLAEP